MAVSTWESNIEDLVSIGRWWLFSTSAIFQRRTIPPFCGALPQARYRSLGVPVSTSVRDLGVIMDPCLRFSDHCASASLKASRVANLILRIFKTRDPIVYTKAFCSYVRPILEYASPVWSPRLISDVNVIERVQRRYTKSVFSRCYGALAATTSYLERASALKLETLELRRARADMYFVHDLFYRFPPRFLAMFFSPSTSHTRGHPKRLALPNFTPRSELSRSHFCWRAMLLWNSLPDDVVMTEHRTAFKTKLLGVPVNILVPASKIR